MEREKLQLENVGDAATITVQFVNEVSTKFGTKLVFVGTDNTETPLIPDTTADKQLARLQLDRRSAVGEALTFSRAANPSGKPYWNIDVATAPRPASKRLTREQAASAPPHPGPVMPFDRDPEAPDPWDDPAERHPAASKQEAKINPLEVEYLALYERVAKFQARVGRELGFPVDGSSVQATTFSIFGKR